MVKGQGGVRDGGRECQGRGVMGGSCGGPRPGTALPSAGPQKQAQEVEQQDEAGVAGTAQVPRNPQREKVTGQNHFKN